MFGNVLADVVQAVIEMLSTKQIASRISFRCFRSWSAVKPEIAE
jgi:hypothetical protein